MQLLRIAMDAKQVREACADWIRSRTPAEYDADARFRVEGLDPKTVLIVVIGKKRASPRKAKGEA